MRPLATLTTRLRRRTRPAVPGGTRRDFFGDRIRDAAPAPAPLRDVVPRDVVDGQPIDRAA